MSRSRGVTLIDAMVALAIVGIGVGMLVGPWTQYARATQRAVAADGVARVLDLELERARSCPTRACIEALPTTTTTPGGAETWARATVTRVVRPGPHGTMEVEISAVVPDLVRSRRVVTRVWRP